MAKNTKTFGLIPKGFGFQLTTNKYTRVVFSPSRAAEGIFLSMTPREKIEFLKANSIDYDLFKSAVINKKGTQKLVSQFGINKIDTGGTVVHGNTISRGDGRKSNSGRNRIASHETSIKGVQMINSEVLTTFFPNCTCEDSTYGFESDEFHIRGLFCAHSYALLHSVSKYIKDPSSLESVVHECKPLLKGDVFLPFEMSDSQITYALSERYLNGSKLYGIDTYLMKQNILTKKAKELIDERKGLLTCIKMRENYPREIGRYTSFMRRTLVDDFGFERDGIAKEIFGGCYWNYTVNETIDLRVMPSIDEERVYVKRIEYIGDTPRSKIKEKYGSRLGEDIGYGLDPMRLQMRIDKNYKLPKWIEPSDIEDILSGKNLN